MPIPASQVRLPPGPDRDEAMRKEYREWKKREEERKEKEKERRSSQPTATARATATAIEPNSREAFGKMYPIPETRPDAFRVLKLNPNANQSDIKTIKTAYTRISRSVHPDKNTPDEQTRLECTAKQQQVQAAYELLIKPKGGKKRRTMQKSKSKRLNKHFNKSRRHTQT